MAAIVATLYCLLSLPGCDSGGPPVPVPPPPDERAEFEDIVERLRNVIGDTSPTDEVPEGAHATERQITAFELQPSVDGQPATGTITIRTVAATAESAMPIEPGVDPADAKSDDVDDPVAARETTETTYRLVRGTNGWELAEEPANEVEKLLFEYALP